MTTIKEKISYYLSAKDSQSTICCTLSEVLADIKNGKYQQQIDIVRNQHSIEQYKEEKKKLPMFAVSGVLAHRNDDLANLQEYSNLMVADFDHFATRQDALDFKNKLIQYATSLHLWAIFESPSGLGVKAVLVHDNSDPSEHGRMFLQIKRDLFPKTPQFDMKCGNISRTCFVSDDPDLFINQDPNLQPYNLLLTLHAYQQGSGIVNAFQHGKTVFLVGYLHQLLAKRRLQRLALIHKIKIFFHRLILFVDVKT